MTDTTFSQSFDAQDWARAFVERVRENPSIATDEATMLGWFANALMRGYDEHARRASTEYQVEKLIRESRDFGWPRA